MNYNKIQQAAILHGKGPALVLAGPGSGKTALITGRVHTLIHTFHVSPAKIAVLSFTRASARDMKLRYEALFGPEEALSFGTIHSLFYAILRREYPDKSFEIMEEIHRLKLVGEALKSCLGREPGREETEVMADEIRRLKSEGGRVKEESPAMTAVLESYEARRRAAHLLDFEDILWECKTLFQDPALLARWQARWPYILIDEFQDVSPLQFSLLRALAAGGEHFFAVGDEDQAIYGFRGADQGIILHFKAYFPAAVLYRLKECYRCGPKILKAARRMINHNRLRYKKRLVSRGPRQDRIFILAFEHQETERQGLLEAVREDCRNYPRQTRAVLCRSNRQVQQISRDLWEAGLSAACMTMHGAKGLEFDAVFLPFLNEDRMPGHKKLSREAMEGERRLFYVAMTRAARRLWISYSLFGHEKKREASRFLGETGLKARLYENSVLGGRH